LLKRHFHSLGRMLFETAWSWTVSARRFSRFGAIENPEHAQRAVASGKGLLIISAHFTTLEIGGRLAAMPFSGVHAIYRPLRNPVIEWYQNRCRRKQYLEGVIPKRDMRRAVRVLKNGGIIWTAPDQDFGPSLSDFAPFFGIETATLLATARLARMTGCRVLPLFPHYDSQARCYRARFYPPLEDFPSGDDRADLARINALIEEQVREVPEQYWWIHRRFKTRPPGEAPFYDR
jgi:KDO2-lipid IV(A) lauroyltransferase